MKTTKTRIIFFAIALTYNLLLGLYLKDFFVLSPMLLAFYQRIIQNFEYDYEAYPFIQYFDVRKTLQTKQRLYFDFFQSTTPTNI